MRRLVECVPNFSEGRDLSKVEAILAAIASAPALSSSISNLTPTTTVASSPSPRRLKPSSKRP